MKKKTIRTLLMSALVAGAIALPVACGGAVEKDEVKLELSDWLYWDTLYVNEEYDASGLIKAEEGVEYSIVNCLYFDESFTRHDIATTGMTFTQEEPYNVVVEIQAQKGEAVDSEVVELDINFHTNDVINEIIGSWNDDGVAKSITAKSEYLKDDAQVAIAARYIGTRNPANPNGMAIGILQNSWTACSVTDWSNAVVSVDVYNPNDYAIRFGPQWFEPASGEWHIEVDKEVPANSWAHLEWSLRKWGYDVNYFAAGGQIYFKMAIKDEPDNGTARDYTIYLCNIDVSNYDAEKSPDLDTTKPEVIPAPTTNGGKILDAMSKTYRDANDNPNIKTEITREYDAAYAKGGEFALKIQNSGTFNPAGIQNGVGVAMLDGSAFFAVTDWTNAVLTLDIFNSSDIDLKFGTQIRVDSGDYVSDVSHQLKAGEWTHIDLSLRRIEYKAFSVNSVCFKVGTWEDAPDVQQDYTIYLSNVDVVNYSQEKFPDLETRTDKEIADAEWAAIPGDDLDKKVALYTGKSTNFAAEADTSEHCDQVAGSTSSVKITFTQEDGKGDPNKNRGNFVYDNDGTLFNEFTVTDWSNAYLGFWVKTGDLTNNAGWCAATVQLRFATTADGTTYTGSQYFNFQSYQDGHDQWILNNYTDWTYIEFSLNALNIGTQGVTGFKFALCAECAVTADGQSLSFYIDGLNIYSKKPQTNSDKILAAVNTTHLESNDAAWIEENLNQTIAMTRTIVTDKTTGSGSTSLKVEKSGTFNPNGNNGVTIGLLTGSENFSVTDWSNAKLVFDIYNDAAFDLKFGIQISPDGGTNWVYDVNTHIIESGAEAGWVHVEISLKDLGYTEFSTNTIYFKAGKAEDCSGEEAAYTFYLCNLDVVNG